MKRSWLTVFKILGPGLGTIWAPPRSAVAYVVDVDEDRYPSRRGPPSTVRTATLDAMVEAGLLELVLGNNPTAGREDRHWYIKSPAAAEKEIFPGGY